MKKRRRDDEQLPPFHPFHLHEVLHIPGTSNTASASNIVGASITTGASNTVSASDAVGASNTVGTDRMLPPIAIQGMSNTASARATAGADIPGINRLVGAHQPLPTVYLVNPHDNLRMLEIRANMDAFATTPILERALCGSNTVVLWRR